MGQTAAPPWARSSWTPKNSSSTTPLLVTTAELIAHAVLNFDVGPTGTLTARQITSGTEFANARIRGVVEADFFDWVTDTPPGNPLYATSAAESPDSIGAQSNTTFESPLRIGHHQKRPRKTRRVLHPRLASRPYGPHLHPRPAGHRGRRSGLRIRHLPVPRDPPLPRRRPGRRHRHRRCRPTGHRPRHRPRRAPRRRHAGTGHLPARPSRDNINSRAAKN